VLVSNVGFKEERLKIRQQSQYRETGSITNLNIVLLKLLGERSTPIRKRIDCIVDGNLTIFVVQPSIDILPALLQDLLTKHNRGCRGVDKEVILRDFHIRAHRGSTIVTQVEDSGLDSQPENVKKESLGD
jgi:hypothetical protein